MMRSVFKTFPFEIYPIVISFSTEVGYLIFFFSQSVSLTQYVVLSVRHPVILFQLAYCLNDQANFA